MKAWLQISPKNPMQKISRLGLQFLSHRFPFLECYIIKIEYVYYILQEKKISVRQGSLHFIWEFCSLLYSLRYDYQKKADNVIPINENNNNTLMTNKPTSISIARNFVGYFSQDLNNIAKNSSTFGTCIGKIRQTLDDKFYSGDFRARIFG